jgi:peptidyl-prolyl cis-trans isomerase B (cyclophilin B)
MKWGVRRKEWGVRCTFAVLVASLVFAVVPTSSAQSDASLPADVEALIETTKGDVTIRFFPDKAPKHVQHFLETARSGGFNGTTFHRAVPYAIIQGGDPLSKDLKKTTLYGTGGLKLLPDEFNDLKHLPGAVSAVAIPGPDKQPLPNSSGTQFFICDGYMSGLDGKYSIFGRVTRGMDVVRTISALPTKDQKLVERVEIKRVTVRPVTPTLEEMRKMRVHVATPVGTIVMQVEPDASPETARHFLDLVRAGFYDGLTFYRAWPGFVLQGGQMGAYPERHPNQKRSFSLWPLADEFNTPTFDKGMVGLAHGDAPNSGTVHFFILLGRAQQLDNKYAAFARVVSGIEVAETIVKGPVTGDRLNEPVAITRMWIE